jgi:hypothetical protein
MVGPVGLGRGQVPPQLRNPVGELWGKGSPGPACISTIADGASRLLDPVDTPALVFPSALGAPILRTLRSAMEWNIDWIGLRETKDKIEIQLDARPVRLIDLLKAHTPARLQFGIPFTDGQPRIPHAWTTARQQLNAPSSIQLSLISRRFDQHMPRARLGTASDWVGSHWAPGWRRATVVRTKPSRTIKRPENLVIRLPPTIGGRTRR